MDFELPAPKHYSYGHQVLVQEEADREEMRMKILRNMMDHDNNNEYSEVTTSFKTSSKPLTLR